MKNPDGVAVLEAAAALVKQGRCLGANARDAHGKEVFPHDPRAVEWDVCGALLLSGRDTAGRSFMDALHAFAQAVGVFGYDNARDWRCEELPMLTREMCEKVWAWEDAPHRTTEHVLSAFERAVRLAKGEDIYDESVEQEAGEAARTDRSRKPERLTQSVSR